MVHICERVDPASGSRELGLVLIFGVVTSLVIQNCPTLDNLRLVVQRVSHTWDVAYSSVHPLLRD